MNVFIKFQLEKFLELDDIQKVIELFLKDQEIGRSEYVDVDVAQKENLLLFK